jgi:hypothetical protein
MSIKQVIARSASRLLQPIIRREFAPYSKQWDLVHAVNQTNQLNLMLHYRQLVDQRAPLPAFEDVEFRSFSQNGEDGILLLIFSLIGTTNKKCVEICAGDGVQCNCANLIINHGWIGLLFDGDESNIERGRQFYARCRDTFTWPPRLVHSWITAENVNELVQTHGFEGQMDLLSLDMDGVDWWVWRALDCVDPRVVVLEYNNLWGPEKAVTVPYEPSFVSIPTPHGRDYAGASLAAFVKLGNEKGYRLVGCQRYGFNAFFVKRGLAEDSLPEISPDRCFFHPFSEYARTTRIKNVQEQPWVEV